MFDTRFLTPLLRSFLAEESIYLRDIFERSKEYNHLVEVGCGYGRYMSWALASGIAYDGIDVVGWLIDMAELKKQQLQQEFNDVHCAVHVHPAERLHLLLDSPVLYKPKNKTLVFFPFNCFGNVADVGAVMRSLYRERCDIVISTFKTDAKSTEIRKEYYANCGYSNLECRLSRHGLVITSDEGFHALAYQKEALENMFQRNGYQLASYADIGEIGAIYFFKATSCEPETLKQGHREMMRRYPRYKVSIPIALHVLNEQEALSRENHIDPASLLSFEESVGVTRDISADGVSLICDRAWKPGAIVKIELVLDQGDSGSAARFCFIGTIRRTQAVEEGHLIALKFFRPEAVLIDDFFTMLNNTRLLGNTK